ncbi:MAG: DUF4870 domain-containing protein [Anaerolineae bacterium]|nr:DUF4870 domain-containing protein [Anaerolineae bacterium]
MINNTDTSQLSQSERLLSAFSHVSILIPRIGLLVPLIIWIIQAKQKSKSHFLTFQSLQALIYQMLIMLIGFIDYWSIFFIPTTVFVAYIDRIVTIGLIVNFILITYGIIGAILTFQGKSFRYWIIGKQVERFMPTVSLKPSIIYIPLIVFVLINFLAFAVGSFLAIAAIASD